MAKTLKEIKEILADKGPEELPELLAAYREDKRAGVKKLVESYDRKIDKYETELLRIEGMKEFEKAYPDCEFICGVDEVGRGPLAGPVVAGAVILPKDVQILYLNDSKQLRAAKREELYEEIYEKAIAVGIGMADVDVIDSINILNADYEAMKIAIGNLSVKPDLLLNDAVHIPEILIPQVSIIKGDTKSVSIAAASIVAKVTRDRMMVAYDEIYPEYGFASNKGYGSAAHIAALKEFGPCSIHRKTFIKNFI